MLRSARHLGLGALPGLLGWALCLTELSAASTWPSFDFTNPDQNARWQLNRYLEPIGVSAEGWELAIKGMDPYLTGPAADYSAGQPLWLRLTLWSETGGSCQIFYFNQAPSEANSVRFQVPANKWVTGRVPLPALGAAYRLRIDPPGTSGRVILKSLTSEPRGPFPEFDFRTLPDAGEWVPQHDITALTYDADGLAIHIGGTDPYMAGPPRDYPPDPKLWMHLKLKSEVGGTAQMFYYRDHPSEQNSIRFFVPAGEWYEALAPLPALGAGWKLRFDPPGSSGVCVLERLWFEPRTAFESPQWPKPRPIELGADPIEINAGGLTLRHARNAFGAFEVAMDGKRMAVGLPNTLLGYLHRGQPVWAPLGDAPATRTFTTKQGETLRTVSYVTDPDGGRWQIEQRYTPDGPRAISVETRLVVDRDRDALYVPVLTLLPGVGAFGTNKTQGLFCGLEYLANEPSSSEADVRGDEARRLAPATFKITIPLMALAAEGRYIALSWEPAEEVCAVFDSPDRQFQSGGHLMGLIAPGSDGFNRDQGSLVPYQPLRLAGGQPLVARATIMGGPGDTVVSALQQYVQRHGLPAPPAAVPSAQEYYRLAARGWLDSRIREGNLYRHAFWPSFRAGPAADAAVWMRWLAGQVEDAALKARLNTAAQEALEAIPDPAAYNSRQIGHVTYPLPALVFNQATANADQAAATARNLLRRFEPNGHVIYRPPPGGTDYGVTHFSREANGYTAAVVQSLLENAAVAADADLIREALARLRAMDHFRHTVPRGAQTWEIPLHTPDILASARLVRCYVMGYELTGDPDLLEQARYWAWTGLPFVYLRQPVPGTVGLYATVPVYGATGWVGSWFGRPVQWCGMVYADALNRLAVHDPHGPWRRLADGISASGVQQTWPDTDLERHGLLPDFVRLREQYRDGPAINPATVLAGALRFYGAPAPYTFRTFRRYGLRTHAAGTITDIVEAPDRLTFTLSQWSDGPSSLLMNGFAKAPQVRINGHPITLAPQDFDLNTGRLVLGLAGTVRVEIIYPELPRVQIRRGERARTVQLLWPRQAGMLQIEGATSFWAPQWLDVPAVFQAEGDYWVATVAAQGPARFFRVHTTP